MLQNLQAALSRVMPAATRTGLFVSRATFQARAGDPGEQADPLGQVNLLPSGYANVDGLVNIPCMFAPQSVPTPSQGDTVRTEQQFETKTEFHLLLNAYYPAVQQRYLVIVDGVTYEVMGVESDSQDQMTRCAVRAYTI